MNNTQRPNLPALATVARWPGSAVAPGLEAGLIQSLSHGLLPGLSAWAEVGGIAPSLCLKVPPLQPIST